MTRIVLTITTSILTILTVIFGLAFISTITLPYNSEGNYFDESSMVVYHKQTMEVYGILTFLLFALTIISAYLTIKKIRVKKTDK